VSRHVSFIELQDAQPCPYRPGIEIGMDLKRDSDGTDQPSLHTHHAPGSSDELEESLPPNDTPGDCYALNLVRVRSRSRSEGVYRIGLGFSLCAAPLRYYMSEYFGGL
jgi:hypothetical protein